MTEGSGLGYCPPLIEAGQSKAAFVIHVREGADVQAGRLEGKVEHIASYKAARFHSVDELLSFIAGVLTECKRSSGHQ
jgi:hypothetical protein